MTYFLKIGRGQKIFIISCVLLFTAFSFMSYQQHEPIPALGFLAGALTILLYAAPKANSWLSFDPHQPSLVIKNGFSAPITIQPSDCVQLTQTKGRAITDKLLYRANGRSKSMVLYNSNHKADVAWAQYTKKWLQAIKTDGVKKSDVQFEQVLNSPNEKYFNEHYGKSKRR